MPIMRTEEADSLLKLIANNGVIIFIGSIIGKVLRFIFFIILIRVLGASLYGLYSIGQSIIDIVTNIGLLGDGRGLIRFGASFIYDKDTPRLKGVILSYLLICSLLSIIISASIFCFAEQVSSRIFHNSALTGVLKIFAVGFPFYIFSLTIIPIGYAFQKMKYKVIIQEVMQPVINIIAIIIIFMLGGRLYGSVIGFVISSFFSAILAACLIKDVFPDIITKTKCIFQSRELMVYSFPIMGVIFCYYLLFRLDRVMLGVFRSPYEVGVYSAAGNIAMFMLVFTSIFEAGVLPAIAQLDYSNKKEELKRIFNCVTFWGTSFAFIPCISLLIFNREIVSLFGSNFIIGGWVLIILCLSFFMEAIPGQLRQLLQMGSRQNIEFINSFVMIIANIVLSLVLIPRFGMNGAALAVFLSLFFVSLIRLIETKIFFGFIPFTPRYIKFLIFIICAIIVSLLFIIDKNIFLRILSIIIIITSFLLLLFKFKSEEDILVWNSIKAKFR